MRFFNLGPGLRDNRHNFQYTPRSPKLPRPPGEWNQKFGRFSVLAAITASTSLVRTDHRIQAPRRSCRALIRSQAKSPITPSPSRNGPVLPSPCQHSHTATVTKDAVHHAPVTSTESSMRWRKWQAGVVVLMTPDNLALPLTDGCRYSLRTNRHESATTKLPACFGHFDRTQFASSQNERSWTNRRELRRPRIDVGRGDLLQFRGRCKKNKKVSARSEPCPHRSAASASRLGVSCLHLELIRSTHSPKTVKMKMRQPVTFEARRATA